MAGDRERSRKAGVHVEHAVVAEGLEKRFGSTVALAGVDLSVERGTVLGVLGPNGAGKTTTVRILTTLLPADGGRAVVAGHDVARAPQRVRAAIGLSGQFSATDGNLTGRENLRMVGRLYQLGRREARRRADHLLERLGLGDAADRPVRGYSGGMNRRLDLAAAIIGRAPVLFLDEPTTGLDPASRRDIWDLVRELVEEGTTLLLTTQYLDEADRLADRIAVIDRGAVIAEGTAEELKGRVGQGMLELRPADPARIEDALRALADLGPAARIEDERTAPGVAIPVGDDHELIARAVRAVDDAGVALLEVGVRRPSLDDVFLTLTRGERGGASGAREEGP